MTSELTLPCADGGDAECYGRVPPEVFSENYYSLSDDQYAEFLEKAGEHKTNDDFVAIIDGVEVTAECKVCSACGSDY